jgi:hypothetical protein
VPFLAAGIPNLTARQRQALPVEVALYRWDQGAWGSATDIAAAVRVSARAVRKWRCLPQYDKAVVKALALHAMALTAERRALARAAERADAERARLRHPVKRWQTNRAGERVKLLKVELGQGQTVWPPLDD